MMLRQAVNKGRFLSGTSQKMTGLVSVACQSTAAKPQPIIKPDIQHTGVICDDK